MAQDLASYGRDQGVGERGLVPLIAEVAARVDRVRLLYLYPSDLTDALVDAVCDSGVPYFDLSLQHVSRPLLRRMRRWGDGERFLARIADIRRREPDAALRSNFIVGYPGETEEDHDALLAFVEQADLDWCGFFSYSREDGTYAADLDGTVPDGLVAERLAELREVQDATTERRRAALVGPPGRRAGRRAGRGSHPPRGPRDRRRRQRARAPAGRRGGRAHGHRLGRARPRRRLSPPPGVRPPAPAVTGPRRHPM